MTARYLDLITPALDAYTADEIDEAELRRRKDAARERADASPPDGLDALYEGSVTSLRPKACNVSLSPIWRAALGAFLEALLKKQILNSSL